MENTEHLCEKSQNRWKMVKWVLGYLALFGLGLFALAFGGHTAAVDSLMPLAKGILMFAGGLLGINLASPVGGFLRRSKHV